jgi:hypothetical protein
VVGKTDHPGWIIQNGNAADLPKHPREIGIGLQQPAPERDSIGSRSSNWLAPARVCARSKNYAYQN